MMSYHSSEFSGISTHLTLVKMAAILIYSVAFSLMKSLVFLFNSLKFIPKSPFDYKAALVQVMGWCGIGKRPLSEPMLT